MTDYAGKNDNLPIGGRIYLHTYIKSSYSNADIEVI
jgi:hypothetical protein